MSFYDRAECGAVFRREEPVVIQLSLLFPLQRGAAALMEKPASHCPPKTLMIPAPEPISGTSKDQRA